MLAPNVELRICLERRSLILLIDQRFNSKFGLAPRSALLVVCGDAPQKALKSIAKLYKRTGSRSEEVCVKLGRQRCVFIDLVHCVSSHCTGLFMLALYRPTEQPQCG